MYIYIYKWHWITVSWQKVTDDWHKSMLKSIPVILEHPRSVHALIFITARPASKCTVMECSYCHLEIAMEKTRPNLWSGSPHITTWNPKKDPAAHEKTGCWKMMGSYGILGFFIPVFLPNKRPVWRPFFFESEFGGTPHVSCLTDEGNPWNFRFAFHLWNNSKVLRGAVKSVACSRCSSEFSSARKKTASFPSQLYQFDSKKEILRRISSLLKHLETTSTSSPGPSPCQGIPCRWAPRDAGAPLRRHRRPGSSASVPHAWESSTSPCSREDCRRQWKIL